MKLFKNKAYLLILLMILSGKVAAYAGGKQQPPARANMEIHQPAPVSILARAAELP